ncbi:hypothetical protein ACFSQT_09765 [Mesorhizobium calcicola]|uniref:Uncharacterized protein n=1 Tax=Mesorhizobium calcicola TaxID=1300310 RepID=A0ABW4W9P8_9HYPH
MHIADQSGAPSAQRKPFYAQLYVQVLVAITSASCSVTSIRRSARA